MWLGVGHSSAQRFGYKKTVAVVAVATMMESVVGVGGCDDLCGGVGLNVVVMRRLLMVVVV
ncbi:hypothetical protein L195_g043785 [Trifolium pratense]|uniref:Uncharacterized protein n=1 Tax=Trifolium pratense TaxID=57577 RepID=A0A2K3MA82_TRIPR|nr:hypothetical protein L195_g043785 [Trifolium pratense]